MSVDVVGNFAKVRNCIDCKYSLEVGVSGFLNFNYICGLDDSRVILNRKCSDKKGRD